jgi:hypothetical protein
VPRKKASTKKLDITSDYKTVFSSEAGKRVLWDIMRNSFMLDTTFTVSGEHETVLREGHRNSALRILSILQTDEKKLLEQIEEGLEYDREYGDDIDF